MESIRLKEKAHTHTQRIHIHWKGCQMSSGKSDLIQEEMVNKYSEYFKRKMRV